MYPATIAKLDSKNQLVFSSSCPLHQKTSKLLRAKQPNLLGEIEAWVFKCGPDKGQGHLFLAAPCAIGDPTTVEERDAIVARLMSEKAIKVGRGQQ